MPGIGVLRIMLRSGPRTVGELATALGLTSVQASRLISRAEAEGHVRKRKVGRFVHVTVVPIEQLRRKQK
jgi:DNA-binding MarR family transcriptional regulator